MTMERTPPPPRGLAPAALLALLAAGALLGGPAAASAQVPRARPETLPTDTVAERTIIASPRSGPPGTVVTLRPLYLPAITPVQISIGGTRSGFEVLGQMMTDREGELAQPITFEVPSWTEPDGTYRFMVLDLYFAPLAMSDLFYVTGPDGMVSREGVIEEETGGCALLRGEGDETYALSDTRGELEPGDRVVVEGPVVDSDVCPQGTAVEVRRVQRLNGPTPRGARD